MVYENDSKFVIPQKYISMDQRKRKEKIEKVYSAMESHPKRKKKQPIKNPNISFIF